MAEQKKEPVVKTILKEGTKEAVAAAGGFVGLAALIKKYIFPSNSPDASPGTEGLQADKIGRGQADEALFYEAVAEAAKKIEPTDKDAREDLIKRFFTAFNKLKPTSRKNAILCLGLSESKTTVTDPKGGNVNTTSSNTRGINILESWLQLDAKTLKKVLAAPVQPFDIAKERIKELDGFCKKINTEMVKIHGDLPASKTPDKRKECREERRKKIGTNPLSSLFSRRKK